MKSQKKFSWQMWHIYLLVTLVIFVVGSTCSFFFLKEAAYVVKERSYGYTGKGQELTDYKKLYDDKDYPMVALSFRKTDDMDDYYLAVGRQYLAFQDSKQYQGKLTKKDKEEYFRIRYYKIGAEKGKGNTVDVLKLAQDMGYPTIEGKMHTRMYSDGRDDYVAINVTNDDEIYVNLTSKKATKKVPKEIVNYDYGGLYSILQVPHYISRDYYDDMDDTEIAFPLTKFEKGKEIKDSSTDSSTSDSSSSIQSAVETPYLSELKKYGFVIILKENITLNDSEAIIRRFAPDISNVYWNVDKYYTKSGKDEYVSSYQEFKEVINEEAIEKHLKDRQ